MKSANSSNIRKNKIYLAAAIGRFVKHWGFKSIHGRIWCLLYLAEKPKDANFLMEALNVSKGLISLAMKDLQEYGVVLKCENPEKETQCYRANPKVMEVIANVLLSREMKLIDDVLACQKQMLELDPDALLKQGIHMDRLKLLGEMTGLAKYAVKGFANMEFEELKGFLLFNDNEEERPKK